MQVPAIPLQWLGILFLLQVQADLARAHRTIHPDSVLVQRVNQGGSESRGEYWGNVTRLLDGFARAQGKEAWDRWTSRVLTSQRVSASVSQQCKNVIQHMLKDPLATEWSAKSEFGQVQMLRSRNAVQRDAARQELSAIVLNAKTLFFVLIPT